MDRLEMLRAGIGLDADVLEIGPYFNPIAPRREGYRVTTIDVFDADELRTRAAGDPNLGPTHVASIEDVDLVGSACDVADLTVAKYGAGRRFAWILSSHNFEHLPNPIRFLQQCAAVLDTNGTLRMAVPDKRYCSIIFDRSLRFPSGYRPTTNNGQSRRSIRCFVKRHTAAGPGKTAAGHRHDKPCRFTDRGSARMVTCPTPTSTPTAGPSRPTCSNFSSTTYGHSAWYRSASPASPSPADSNSSSICA